MTSTNNISTPAKILNTTVRGSPAFKADDEIRDEESELIEALGTALPENAKLKIGIKPTGLSIKDEEGNRIFKKKMEELPKKVQDICRRILARAAAAKRSGSAGSSSGGTRRKLFSGSDSPRGTGAGGAGGRQPSVRARLLPSQEEQAKLAAELDQSRAQIGALTERATQAESAVQAREAELAAAQQASQAAAADHRATLTRLDQEARAATALTGTLQAQLAAAKEQFEAASGAASTLSRDKAAVEGQLKELAAQLLEAQAREAAVRTEIAAVQQAQQASLKEIEQLKHAAAQAAAAAAELVGQRDAVAQKLEAAQKAHAEAAAIAKTEIGRLGQAAQDEHAKAVQLQAELAAVQKASEGEIGQLQQGVEQARAAVAAAAQEKAAVQAQLEAATQQLAAASASGGEKQAQITQLTAQCEKYRAELATLTKTAQDAHARADGLQTELTQAQVAFAQERTRLTQDIDDARAAAAQLRTELETAQRAHTAAADTAKAEIGRLGQAAQDEHAKAVQLQAELAAVRKASEGEIGQLQQGIEQAQATVAAVAKEKAEVQAQLQTATAQLAAAAASGGEKQAQITQLTEQCAQYQAELATLTKTAQDAHARAERLQTELTQAQAAFAQERTQLRKSIADAEAATATATQQKLAVEARLQAATDDLATERQMAVERAGQYHEGLEQLNRRVEEAQQKVASLQQQLSEAQAQAAAAGETNETLNNQLRAATAQAAEVAAEKLIVERRVVEITKELAEMSAIADEALQGQRELRTQLQVATEEAAAAKQELATAQEQHAAAQQELTIKVGNLTRQLAQAVRDKTAIEESLAEMEVRATQAEDRAIALEARAIKAEKERDTIKSVNDLAQARIKQLEAELNALRALHAKCGEKVVEVISPPPARAPERLERKRDPTAEAEAAKKAQAAAAAAQVAALDKPDPSIEEAIDAIRRGDLTQYLTNPRAELAARAAEELAKALTEGAKPSEIYALATYTALVSPQKIDKAKLKQWLIQRAMESEKLGKKEQRLRHSLLSALSDKDLANALQGLEEVRALIVSKRNEGGYALIEWARGLIASKGEKTIIESLFIDLLTRELRDLDKGAKTLWVPNGKNKPENSYSLIEQLRQNPKYDHIAADSRDCAGWDTILAEREEQIMGAIGKCLDLNTWNKVLTHAKFAGEIVPSTLAPVSDEEIQTAIDKGRREGGRTGVLQNIQKHVVGRIAKLTGLTAPTDGNKINACFQEIAKCARTGKFSPLLDRILKQHGGRELLYLAKMLYYYQACENAKPGFIAAAHHHWEWLTRGKTDGQSAERLIQLLNTLQEDPNFKGGVLTADQVKWARGLHNLYTSEQGSPIFAEAGKGKTVTAQFMMRLLPRMGIEKRTVHFVSPFANSIEGMRCHTPETFEGVLRIPASSLNDIVLVDEAHLLAPDKELSCRVLLVKDGVEREVFPLLITATPVIPVDGTKAFKQEQLKRYSEQLEKLNIEIHQRKEQIAEIKLKAFHQAVQNIYNEILAVRNDVVKHLSQFILGEGQRKKFGDRIDALLVALKKGDIAEIKEELRVILNADINKRDSSNARLKAIQLGLDQLKREEQSRSQKKDTSTYIPLQKLQNRFRDALMELNKLMVSGIEVDSTSEERAAHAEIARLEKMADAIQEKVVKWKTAGVDQAPTENESYFAALPEKRKEAIGSCEYISTQHLVKLTPELGAQCVSALYKKGGVKDAVQLIFPGVRFQSKEFGPLISKLRELYAQEKRPVRFVYQDSHTDAGLKFEGREVRGNKWVIEFNGSEKPRMVSLEEFSKKEQAPGVTVMLYDRSNLQGGDFGDLSRAVEGRDISQFILYNFTDVEGLNPARIASENDLYQALRRRRGTPACQSVVVLGGGVSKDEFVGTQSKPGTVGLRQKALEKYWAAKYAAQRIARKLMKIALLQKHKKADLKGKRNDELLGMLNSSDQGLVDKIQSNIYAGKKDATLEKWFIAAEKAASAQQDGQSAESFWHTQKKHAEVQHYLTWAQRYGS
ncbi:MAG: hypothetical protein HYX48_02740 [Chlamydiales bacterium]|nr:hypothetical protein [Chlamydiales bacterium]